MIYPIILAISALGLAYCLHQDWKQLATKRFPYYSLVVCEAGGICIIVFIAVMEMLTKGLK